MEMKDVKNEWVKIGETSITVKNRETGKTKGIITNVQLYDELNKSDQFEYWHKYKDVIMSEERNHLLWKDSIPYYLYSTRDLDVDKKCYDLGYDTSYLKRMETIEKFKNAGIEVIPVWSF